MRDSGELEQLIEAVKRQPGSRAYAMLAERFLEAERVDEALRVCQAGFAANSTYERGALAYLRVLRKLGDTPTAEGVYQRAIGVHPRSSRLRVGWALVMLDEGREREARALAREALDLDPADREARALIATLGGTPPPSLAGSTREYQNPPLRKKDLQATSPPPLPASVRIRPPGQRTSATSLFDLSSAPPGADETPRPRFKRSPFDATPAPMHPVGDGPPTFEPQPAAAEHGPLSAAPREQPRPRRLDQTGEHDLFPEGGGSVTVTSVAEARITGEHAVATRPPSSAEGDIALSDTVSAPAVRKALVTTGPPAPPRPPAGLQGSGPRSALDFTLDSGARDMRDVTDLPLDASAPRTTEIDQLSPSMPVRRKKKRWPLVLLVLLLLLGGGGGTAGFFLYRRHAREQALLELTRLLDSTRVDRRTRYLSVEGKLAKLEAAPSARRAGARALVAAHLLRLGHRNEAQTAAWLRAGQGSHEAELARGLVAVHAALAKGSKAPLPSAPASNSWHGRLLAIEQAILARRWDAVEKLGRDELALGKKAAPAVLLAAAHEATDKKHASALIAAGLAVSPEHAGLRIERALVAEKPAGG
ncbi:MAG: hypothetical protein KC503_17565, partial [Myxococcales bacterium]|nr:hypothetical protein [Myxococcales bacterium]